MPEFIRGRSERLADGGGEVAHERRRRTAQRGEAGEEVGRHRLLLRQRGDRRCGFGGVFSVEHPELSAEFLKRKIANFEKTESPTLVVADTGCLMHIQGGLIRQGKSQRVVHIAEILARSGAEK